MGRRKVSSAVIKIVLAVGQQVNIFTIKCKSTGEYPLNLACSLGKVTVVKLIIDACTEMNYPLINLLKLKNGHGRTPLHCVFDVFGDEKKQSPIKILRYLLPYDKQNTETDNLGNTVLHLACKNNNQDSVYLLHMAMGDELTKIVDAKNNEGNTALHIVCQSRKLDIAKLLVVIGADVTVKDKNGCTALEKAYQKGGEFVGLAVDLNKFIKTTQRDQLLVTSADQELFNEVVIELSKS